jgi:hypothetical protein
MNQQMSDQELQELIRRQISSVPSPFVQLPQVPAAGGMPRMIDPSMVTDWTSQPYSMPAAVGSFNPFELRGAGLLTEGTGMMPASTVPLYPARVVRSKSSSKSSGGGGGYLGDFGHSFSGFGGEGFGGGGGYSGDPNSYTGGLVGSLFGGQVAAPVVDMTFVDGMPSPTYGQVSLGGPMGPSYGGVGGGYVGSIDNSMSQSDMMGAQEAGMNDGGSSDSKIVCTAMNHAYGFGGFRQSIWLSYSAKHLTKAHEVGYHALFLPLVNVGYNQGDKMHSRIIRKALEHVARHRTADLRAEMRGTKRDTVGRAYRLILEPLCFAVGKLKGY